MSIVGGLDLHRKQITFDYLDTETGEVRRGRIEPADRERLREWLARFAGLEAAFAVEGCTGWRYVVEELARAGIVAHLAEPAQTADADARRRKRRAKSDRIDARTLRDLLAEGRLPESWIPPEHALEMRAVLELFKDLRDEHTAWVQRVHAICFHHGLPAARGDLLAQGNRDRLQAGAGLSPAGRLPSRSHWASSTILTANWTRCAARSPATPAASRAAGRCWPSTAPARSLPRPCGPSSATPAGSPLPARPSATPGSTSPSTPPTPGAPPAGCPARAPRCCAGRCTRPASALPGPAPRTTPTTSRFAPGPAGTAPRCRSAARSPAARTTSCAPSATRPSLQPPDAAGGVPGGP